MLPSSSPAARAARSPALPVAVAVLLLLAALQQAGGAPLAPPAAPDVAWSHARSGDGSPPRALVAVAGHTSAAVAVAFDARVDLLDADSGATLWSNTDLPRHGLSLAAADLNGDGIDDVLVATAALSEPPARLTALRGTDGEVLWTSETGGLQVNDIIVHGSGADAIVVTASMASLASGFVEAFHAETGTLLWSIDAGGVPMTLAAHGALVAAGTANGQVHSLEPRTGTLLATVGLPTAGAIRALVALPALVGVTLVAVGDDTVTGLLGFDAGGLVTTPALLVAWSHSDGTARFWSATSAPNGLLPGAATIYVNARGGPHVHALNAQDGTLLWQAGDGGTRTSIPYVAAHAIVHTDATGDGVAEVVAGGAGAFVRAYDAATGALRYEARTPGATDFLAAPAGAVKARIVAMQQHWLVTGHDGDGNAAWSLDLAPYQAGATLDRSDDGGSDIALVTSGHLYLHRGDDGAELLRVPLWPHLENAIATNIAAADLTGNGVQDLIATARSSDMKGVVVAIDATGGDTLWTFDDAAWIPGAENGGLRLIDISGDGTMDVIVASNRGHPSHVIALAGATGAEIWRHHVQDDVLSLDVVATSQGPRVLVLHDHNACACYDEAGIIVLDAQSGTPTWTRSLANDNARDLAIARSPDADQIVVIEDDAVEAPSLLFLDIATGAETRLVQLDAFDVPPLTIGPFFMAADVDGDGRDEIVFTLREPGGDRRETRSQVAVLAGNADALLWTSQVRDGTVFPLAAAPRAGSGNDLLAAWSDGSVARLGAGDGAPAWLHGPVAGPIWFLAPATSDADPLVFLTHGTTATALAPGSDTANPSNPAEPASA